MKTFQPRDDDYLAQWHHAHALTYVGLNDLEIKFTNTLKCMLSSQLTSTRILTMHTSGRNSRNMKPVAA